MGNSFRSIAVSADAGCGLDIHGFAEGFCTRVAPSVTVDDFEQSDIFRDLDISRDSGTGTQSCGLKPDGRVECSKFGTRSGMFELGAGAELSATLNYMVVPQNGNSVCGIKREDKSVVCSVGRVALPVSQSGSQIEYLTFAANATGSCGIALDGENANRLVCMGAGSNSAPDLEGGDGEYVSVGLYYPSGFGSLPAKACGVTKLGDLRCQGGSPLTFEGLQKVGFYVDGVLPKLVDKDFPSVFRGNVTVSFAPSELSTVYAVFTDRSDLTDAELMEMSTPVSLSTIDRFEKTYYSAGDAVARDYYFYVVQDDAVLNRSFFRSTMRDIGSSPTIVDGTTLTQIYAKETTAELTFRASDPNPNEATSLIWSLGVADIPAGTTVVFVTDTGSSSTARGDTVVVLFERPESPEDALEFNIVVTATDPEGNADSLTVKIQSIARREPMIAGSVNRQLKREVNRNSTGTLIFEARDDDPGDDPNLRWTLSSTETLFGNVEILGSRQGTRIEVQFVPKTGSSMHGSFELNVSDQLSTTSATVKLVYGFSPVIEDGASILKSLIYVKRQEARLSLTAVDTDTSPKNLIWSIVGTPSELTMGTTVSFVLENDSLGSTAHGGTVVMLFERPVGSTAGASVEVEVRDLENNTARTTVQFEHVPNRKPVIVGAINGELAENIPIRGGRPPATFRAYDVDPGDTEILVWFLDTSGLSTGVTAGFLGSPVDAPVGESVEVSIMRDPVAATELGFFVLKVSDLLSTTTATVAVIRGSEPVIEGGASSVKSLIYAKQTTAERSLTATLADVQVDALLWSIASTDTGTSLPTGTTVNFVSENDSRGSTARGGAVVVLYERPERELSGGSVVVVASVEDEPRLRDSIIVVFEAVANRTPIIKGGSPQSRRISASDTTTVLMFEASDEDPGHGEDLQWTLDTEMSGSATAQFAGSTRGESVAIVVTPATGTTTLGSFQLAVTDDLSTDMTAVSLTYGFPPVIENGESSTVRVYAKETRSTVLLSASDPDTAPEYLVWSIAGTPRDELAMGTTVSFALAGASTSSTVRGSTVVVLFERPMGSTVGASVEVEVRDPQNNTTRSMVVFEAVPNRAPVIVGSTSRRLVFSEAATTALRMFEARDEDPGHATDLRWFLSTETLSGGSADFYGSEDARRGSTIQILFTRPMDSGEFGSFVLEVTDGLSTDSVTVELMYGLPPVIEDGESSTTVRVYANQAQATKRLVARDPPDDDAQLLLWTVLGGNPKETTAVFVLANDSRGSTVKGSIVVLLLERPSGSSASVVVEVEVKDTDGSTSRITVMFEVIPNRAPVIVGESTRDWVIPAGELSVTITFSARDEDPPDRDRLEWSIEDCSKVLGGSVRFIGSAACGDTQTGANVGVEFSRDAPPRPGGSFSLKVTDGLADARIMVSLESELEPEPESKQLRARVYLGGAVR